MRPYSGDLNSRGRSDGYGSAKQWPAFPGVSWQICANGRRWLAIGSHLTSSSTGYHYGNENDSGQLNFSDAGDLVVWHRTTQSLGHRKKNGNFVGITRQQGPCFSLRSAVSRVVIPVPLSRQPVCAFSFCLFLAIDLGLRLGSCY